MRRVWVFRVPRESVNPARVANVTQTTNCRRCPIIIRAHARLSISITNRIFDHPFMNAKHRKRARPPLFPVIVGWSLQTSNGGGVSETIGRSVPTCRLPTPEGKTRRRGRPYARLSPQPSPDHSPSSPKCWVITDAVSDAVIRRVIALRISVWWASSSFLGLMARKIHRPEVHNALRRKWRPPFVQLTVHVNSLKSGSCYCWESRDFDRDVRASHFFTLHYSIIHSIPIILSENSF